MSRPLRDGAGHPTGGRVAAYACIFTTIIAWAAAFPLIRRGLEGLAPLPLAAGRFAIAAAALGLWLAVSRSRLPGAGDAAKFLACGAIGIAFYNGLLNSGQQTVSAGAASFIINSGPVITALLAWMFLGERFGKIGWLGSGIGFAGVAVIALNQPGGLALGAGASLVFAAACCQAIYFTLQWPLVSRYGALPSTAYTLIAGAILLSPWLPEAAVRIAGGDAEWWPVLALGLLSSLLGFAAWTYALGHFGAGQAANFLYLVPPVALIIAFFVTGEVPAPATIIGGCIAICGVALVNLRNRLADWLSPKRGAPILPN
jgi:drug/metabolite transporter (DMT)-like permease